MTIEFSLTELAKEVDAHNRAYAERKIIEIIRKIKRCTIAGEDHFWFTFFWEDGAYAEVIEFFEKRGVSFGSPTGPHLGGSTSFVVSWDISDVKVD